MKPRFSIRDLIWFGVVVALAIIGLSLRSQLSASREENAWYKAKIRMQVDAEERAVWNQKPAQASPQR